MSTVSLADHRPAADGIHDDTAALESCFAAAARCASSTILIPPGAYRVSGERAIAVPSNTLVSAHGARFLLPESLGEEARLVVFHGRDATNVQWHGGLFEGRCFDHRRTGNTWAPNANTRMLVFDTSPGGATQNLIFRDVQGSRVAGSVINVEGAGVAGSESEVHTFARGVSVRDCRLDECGKFMWDYGLLWQILVWAEEYTPQDVEMATRYFRSDLLQHGVRMRDGDDRVELAADPPGAHGATVCFFGGDLPANVVRGRMYHIVASDARSLRIAQTPGGQPVRFQGATRGDVRAIFNLSHAFHHLYAPLGAGPGKGGVDVVCCRDVSVTGCRLSALGDTMHIQRCHNTVFANNQITGSRMGAFFLAEHCRNSTVTGNTVDGTNGSRVMSVERSNEDVTIVGNTFRGGGRGSWINQPRRLIMQGNVFVNNTTKGERDPWRGRRSFETADYERWPEMYFTRYEADGVYGPVILRDNIFATGPECGDAITFAAGGRDIVVEGNVFEGARRTLRVDPACVNVQVRNNINLE